jgi:WD40 repeat protein
MIPNENRVIIGSREGSVGVFDLTQKKFDFQTPGSHTESIFDCEFCASDPDIFATSSFDASIKLWDMQTYECLDTLGGESVIYSLSWHPTRKLVAGAFDSGSVYIYDVLKRAILLKSTLHKQTSFKVAWNQLNPTLLASTSKDKTCVVFAEDGKLVRTYRHGATVFGVDWSPLNQNLLATGAHDYAVRVYDVEQITEHAKVVLKGHTSEVFNVKWHPTLPNILVSGSNDLTVRVWNITTESCIVLQGHTNNVRALHWSPEFSHIVLSGSWDGTIRVWDCHTQKCITTVNDHHADVYGLSSHPKRPFVFGSTSRDSTIRFFSLESTFKELFIRAVTKKSLSELIGTPQSIFNQQATFGKISGSGSKEVNSALSLANSDVERFGTLYDFLSAPHDTRELWNMASICVLQNDYTPKKTKLVHSCQLTSTLEIKARELESIKHKKFTGIGMARKEDALREAALIFLKIGQVQKYCECMAHIGQWEKALALAPAVSQYYWAELSLQHARHLAAAGNDDCVPIYIVTGEVEKAVDFLVSRNQIDDAVVIAQANAEASYPLRSRITSPITPTGLDETLSPVSPASPNTAQKTSGSVGPCIPVTIDDNIKRVIQLNAQRYLNNALPTLAAATYLSINAYDQAIQVLVQGNETLLAYALVLALKNVHSEQYDDLICSVATLCIDNNLHDLGTDLLENVSNRKQIDRVVVQVPQDKKEKIFVKVGLQSVNFYASQAGQTSNKADSIRFYALCGDNVKSATVYCAYAKELFSKAWDWNVINEATDAVHVCDASELNPPLRDELLAYCNFVAAKNALDKGYYTVAPCMVRNTRNLVKNGSFEFGIKQSELDTLLVEAYVNYDREEASHLIKQILESKSLSGESIQKMTTLHEQLFNKILPPIDNSVSHFFIK